MVRQINIEWWACPYCHEKYKDEDDANECAKECVEADPAEEAGETTQYFCEMCNKEKNYFHDAESCEERHIQQADRYYEEYIRQETMKKLAKAASHPGQMKLNEVKAQ